MKRTWKKPELIVLVRARPEENVLEPCKYPNRPVLGPSIWELECKKEEPGCSTCSADTLT